MIITKLTSWVGDTILCEIVLQRSGEGPGRGLSITPIAQECWPLLLAQQVARFPTLHFRASMDGANQALQGPGSASPKENVVVGRLGGAPKAQDVGKMKDVEKMKKDELMQFAKDVLGVETREAGPDGKKNRWRKVERVKADCRAEQNRLCQAAQENVESAASVGRGRGENQQAIRRKAIQLGIMRKRKGTPEELQARIQKAIAGQQNLRAAFAKSIAARLVGAVAEQSSGEAAAPDSGSCSSAGF